MTEEFQRGVIPLARYQEQQLPEYQDNPLISALPPIPDLQEVVDLLQQLPGFEPQEALLDGRLRAHAIARLLHGFFQPLSHHLELESKISLMIRQGYIGRNPASGAWYAHLQNGYRRVEEEDLDAAVYQSVSSTANSLSLFGCSQWQIDSGAVATWALPQGLLVVNADLCTGCQRCEINCTLTNDGVCSSYISRVKIQRRLNLDGAGNGLLSGTDNCWVYFPDTCRQCEDPACGNACPQKAIVTNEQGIRVVDTDKCIGCGACHEACPWHMPTVNPETGKSSKCIACGACVAGCPSGALSIVDWDAVTSAAQAAYMDL